MCFALAAVNQTENILKYIEKYSGTLVKTEKDLYNHPKYPKLKSYNQGILQRGGKPVCKLKQGTVMFTLFECSVIYINGRKVETVGNDTTKT